MQAKKLTATLTLHFGLHLCYAGQGFPGNSVPCAALRELPDGEADLERVIRSNLSVWGRETHRLRYAVQHEGVVDIDRITFGHRRAKSS